MYKQYIVGCPNPMVTMLKSQMRISSKWRRLWREIRKCMSGWAGDLRVQNDGRLQMMSVVICVVWCVVGV